MEEIKCMAKALGSAIQASPYYQDYLYYANRMHAKPALAKKIALLKQMQMSVAPSQPDGRVSLESEMKLCDIYADVTMDEDAIGFWNTERQLLGLIQDTLEIVSECVPMDLMEE